MNKYATATQRVSNVCDARRKLRWFYKTLFGLLCCLAAIPGVFAQKRIPGGINDTTIGAGNYQISNITTGAVNARDNNGRTIKFNVPQSKLNVGQRVWVAGNRVNGVVLPINGEIRSKVGAGDWMETTVTISNNGRIDGKTRTWTTVCADGFTGGVIVFLFDQAGNVLHSTPLKKYGVNGTCVPSAPSNRTEYWNNTVSVDIVNKTRSVKIVHVKKPTDRIDEFLEKAKEVAEIVKIFAEAYQDIAGGGGTGGSGPTEPVPAKPKVP
jgi:hypothetical protein